MCISFSLATSLCFADANDSVVSSQFTLVTFISIFILLMLSGIFLTCLLRLLKNRNKFKDNFNKIRIKHDELLEQKHQWLDKESELMALNLQLEKRITARTETVNKVNHELTKALENTHEKDQTIHSLATALEYSQSKILIIDKHYRVCFASKSFLGFTGLTLNDIEDQPLKRLEKNICLPEMSANGLTLNKEGLIETQLKCLDAQGSTHFLDANIALSWSKLREILHYVIIFDDLGEVNTSPSN